jgi:hypothetical protein
MRCFSVMPSRNSIAMKGWPSCWPISGFAAEAFQGLRVARDVFREKFQRDEAAEFGVFSLVNDAHASTAQFFEHTIVRDGAADRRLRFRHEWRTS